MPDVSLEEQLKQPAASLPGIRLLVLFGSAARGSSDRRRSDVNVGMLDYGRIHAESRSGIQTLRRLLTAVAAAAGL